MLCYFLIWYVPPVDQGKIGWYLIFYCLFQTLQTVSNHFILTISCSLYGFTYISFDPLASSVSQKNSASMYHTLLLPCLSALNRKRGIRPQPTVSFKASTACYILWFPFAQLTIYPSCQEWLLRFWARSLALLFKVRLWEWLTLPVSALERSWTPQIYRCLSMSTSLSLMFH